MAKRPTPRKTTKKPAVEEAVVETVEETPVVEETHEVKEVQENEEAVVETVEETPVVEETHEVKEVQENDEAAVEIKDQTADVAPEETNRPDSGVALDTVEEVEKYLARPGITIVDKLQVIAQSGPTGVRMHTAKLLGIKDALDNTNGLNDENTIVAKEYDLYNTLKNILTTEDSKLFKVLFDITNLVFKSYGEFGQSYNLFNLVRYDYKWKWGDSTLKTYQLMITIITTLADRSARKANLKKIDFNSEFVKSGITISEDKLNRMIKYYSE